MIRQSILIYQTTVTIHPRHC